MITVTLYGRPGCHLCDEARDVLERLRARLAFDLEEVNIETDAELHARYLERIPVVSVDGRDLFELEVDEAVLERTLGLSSSSG